MLQYSEGACSSYSRERCIRLQALIVLMWSGLMSNVATLVVVVVVVVDVVVVVVVVVVGRGGGEEEEET